MYHTLLIQSPSRNLLYLFFDAKRPWNNETIIQRHGSWDKGQLYLRPEWVTEWGMGPCISFCTHGCGEGSWEREKWERNVKPWSFFGLKKDKTLRANTALDQDIAKGFYTLSVLDVIEDVLRVGEWQVVARRSFGDRPGEAGTSRMVLEVLSDALEVYNDWDLKRAIWFFFSKIVDSIVRRLVRTMIIQVRFFFTHFPRGLMKGRNCMMVRDKEAWNGQETDDKKQSFPQA